MAERFVVEGGHPLRGSVAVSGSKNTAAAGVGAFLPVAVAGGEEAGGIGGHGGVLGAADRDAAPQRVPPFDDEAFSHSACL